MSKLFDIYKNLKQEDSKTLFLFKSGIFYIFLDEDAKIINNLLDLKLTNLNTQIVKCGFPANSLQKYLKLLSFTDYNIKIIDNSSNTSFKVKDFTMNNDNIDLLKTISNVNEENLSVKDAYDFIIIDCPPSLSMLTVNAMTTADAVLVPIQCEYYALVGLC